MFKNLFLLISLYSIVNVESFIGVSNTKDYLVDQWFNHLSLLNNSTENQQYVIKGLNFTTTSLIFLQNQTINVNTDLGVIEGLNEISRNSAVQITDQYYSGDAKITVTFDILFAKSLYVYYPTMYISGEGVKIMYQGINIHPDGYAKSLSAPLTVTLKYSPNTPCTTKFSLDMSSYYDMIAFVTNPKIQLPLNSDIKKNIYYSINAAVQNYFASFTKYINICDKLLNLI